jgi:hypothetical protein
MRRHTTMTRPRGLVTIALLLSLSACGTTWTKPGFTAQQWQQDHYTCQLQSRQAAAGFGDVFSQEIYAKKFLDDCLLVHGYSRQ